MAKEMAEEHPSVRTLLVSTDQEILDVAECVHRGQYKVSPIILPLRLQDQFMTGLHEELGKCLVKAGLQSATANAQSLSRGRRCSWAYSSSQARSPSAVSRRKEIALQPRGDSLSRSSLPHSRGHRSRAQQQSPLQEHHPASKASF